MQKVLVAHFLAAYLVRIVAEEKGPLVFSVWQVRATPVKRDRAIEKTFIYIK